MAWGRDRREAAAEEGGLLAGLWETVKTVVWALLIAGIFRTLFFQPFWIPSGSMKDTLLIGDFLFVNKMAYGYSYASCPSIPFTGIGAEDICFWMDGDNTRIWGGMPERGDVVVFRHPVSGADFIKRLIGLPGDRVQMQNGLLYIDVREPGDESAQVAELVPVEVEPAGEFVEIYEAQGPQGLPPSCIGGPQPIGADCVSDRAIETLPNGVSHNVLDIGRSGADDTGVFTVPEDHFFFMGDNRDNSTDSRFPQSARGVGFVPYENLVGRADRIMFSSAGRSMLAFWTWRPDRFFRSVN